MITFAFALLFGVASTSSAPDGMNGIKVAKRVTAAIKGGAEFQDSDFVRPLEASDKAALRRFAPCKVEEIGYTLLPDPIEPDTYIQNTNDVLVRFACSGVPAATPVGLSLHLQGDKVGTVETHNADLMRAR